MPKGNKESEQAIKDDTRNQHTQDNQGSVYLFYSTLTFLPALQRGIVLFLLCDVIPRCFCTGLHAQRVPFSRSNVQIEQTSCPQIGLQIGDAQFPGFYLMSQFHIAELARRGILRNVVGSTPQQLAYRIGPEFNFRINTRSSYPLGLPVEFAFQAIFRMPSATLQESWNIWQVLDLHGNEQLAVCLNGELMSLEFVYTSFGSRRQTVEFFDLPLLFNSEWHSLFLVVRETSVTLMVDCVVVDTKIMLLRNTVNLDGFTHIGKLKDHPAIAVPVSEVIFV
ncbi:collagen alpha-1(IX) chain-like [Engraulis encrasicolus]|uniref:collagen alpha-1(IX) chain-like n=1 Tax=Engraulis encrasicolus TaxID=184585 RepID=UPI002FD06AE1